VTRPATLIERLASFERAYVEAARIIASDPERYGGAGGVGGQDPAAYRSAGGHVNGVISFRSDRKRAAGLDRQRRATQRL
jgi:hypothetical protein